MADEKINGTVETTAPAKSRRGVGSARGTQRLKFSHEHAAPNGLFIAHLESVAVTKIAISEQSSGMPSFNGLEIPRLSMVFASNESDPAARRYATLSFTAVESNIDTIVGGKSDWKVNTIFDYLKHILNVFVLKGRELTEAEELALSLSFDDTDEQGQYKPVAVEEVIAAYTTLFENFANMMNTAKEGKPAYLDKDGKFIPIWIKLIRYIKNKKGWAAVSNGELSFPTFVGEGVMEIMKQSVQPAIRLDVVKECITPKELKAEAKAPTMPGIGGVIPNATPFDAMPGGGIEGTEAPF